MSERIVEVIKEGEIIRVPESQARDEELFILRNFPDAAVEKNMEESRESKTLDLTYKPKRKVPRVETWRKDVYKRNDVLASLVDNFHWEIVKKRRGLGLSRKQFADQLGKDEDVLKVVENGGLPEDNFALIARIESILGITLRKEKVTREVTLADLQKMDEENVRKEIDKAHGVDEGEGMTGEIEIEE
ncbi:hypothetical protein COU62_00215 [Candidatus Pacearchaeota archaeon CG10_big_fil_rev_8_21_14_0_10_35_219]|nr:hypothetical protein [Candidatus Pacearchaeota archaeon]OIO41827.1 MAG: hypothetical protein AUJ63_04695 [Candidatus Pacearchaeota archaeon CG1_02_35_32]PIO08499.1 MAG: hypothetical protein COU62_00215 [Candidatus Pacearchaeota archaeon CG10_big_fil_rev_8_21_14_0_10_35_219]PIY81802.1 MAG: hypothetical protein COY79_00675 [Candidatus Pacearchaeota archaeon CG_4_10_14_0_8_um_filter_35_169]PIZ80081.1 MAG: hypothetical protein COY00_02320 [Candidatus Pacearchaeota archaeon CG_4_10_14_0_2_um_filt